MRKFVSSSSKEDKVAQQRKHSLEELKETAASVQGEYIVDFIVDHRGETEEDMEFLMRWRGYDADENTWECLEAVDDSIALDDYVKEHPSLKSVVKEKQFVYPKEYILLTGQQVGPTPPTSYVISKQKVKTSTNRNKNGYSYRFECMRCCRIFGVASRHSDPLSRWHSTRDLDRCKDQLCAIKSTPTGEYSFRIRFFPTCGCVILGPSLTGLQLPSLDEIHSQHHTLSSTSVLLSSTSVLLSSTSVPPSSTRHFIPIGEVKAVRPPVTLSFGTLEDAITSLTLQRLIPMSIFKLLSPLSEKLPSVKKLYQMRKDIAPCQNSVSFLGHEYRYTSLASYLARVLSNDNIFKEIIGASPYQSMPPPSDEMASGKRFQWMRKTLNNDLSISGDEKYKEGCNRIRLGIEDDNLIQFDTAFGTLHDYVEFANAHTFDPIIIPLIVYMDGIATARLGHTKCATSLVRNQLELFCKTKIFAHSTIDYSGCDDFSHDIPDELEQIESNPSQSDSDDLFLDPEKMIGSHDSLSTPRYDHFLPPPPIKSVVKAPDGLDPYFDPLHPK
ncbi:hypothetical protein ADUPG1_000399 [Aduncisulcus paluster]|uniref:Chromo domain-containing protein n=1 Tax=Aduncisulcus paluster TaxID=2918883 RepID=A0ABQ5KAZ5_9EUKA|nr:hypothetical protein ADUPG1_000399 [Aduncisulcus paluster]